MNNFNLIEPEECFVDSSLGTGIQNGVIRFRNISNPFQYMSLKNRLTVLFQNDAFRRLYFSEAPSDDEFIRSDRDSRFFKTHLVGLPMHWQRERITGKNFLWC